MKKFWFFRLKSEERRNRSPSKPRPRPRLSRCWRRRKPTRNTARQRWSKCCSTHCQRWNFSSLKSFKFVTKFICRTGRRRSRRPIVPNQEDHNGVVGQRRDRCRQVDGRDFVDRRTHSGACQADDQHRHLQGKSKPQIHLSTLELSRP